MRARIDGYAMSGCECECVRVCNALENSRKYQKLKGVEKEEERIGGEGERWREAKSKK